jgi:glycosyltransferase involved in cell wall biosynthesis
MSVGLPVVSTNVGELRHIVDDGIEGFIRDLDGSVDNFVETLKSLLCASKRRKLGIAARQKVVEQFQIGATIQEYAELMEEYTDSLAR